MKIRVALLLGPDDEMGRFRSWIARRRVPLRWHCKRAETRQEKDSQARKIRKEIASYMTGGTRRIAGITGKENVGNIVKRMRTLNIVGEDKLIQRLGRARYDRLVLEAKSDLAKAYLSLRKARGLTTERSELKKIPENVRKEAGILVFEDRLIRRQKGFGRWERVEGGRYWRDTKGRFSRGPGK